MCSQAPPYQVSLSCHHFQNSLSYFTILIHSSSGGSSSAPTDNTNKLESTVDQIEPFFTKAADDIASQFGSSLDFRISDALAKIGDTLLKMMTDAYNTFTDVLMDAIHELVDLLKQIGNAM